MNKQVDNNMKSPFTGGLVYLVEDTEVQASVKSNTLFMYVIMNVRNWRTVYNRRAR